MKVTYVAVMHVKIKKVKSVRDLADKVIKGLTDNVAIYATPAPPVGDLNSSNVLLEKKIVTYESDKSKLKRLDMEGQAKDVHKILKDLTGYVSGVTSDQKTILLSGFDADKEPEKRNVPKDKIVIKRIDDGPTALSAKIFLEKMPEGNFVDRYKVEKSDDDKSFSLVLETGSSRKLIIPGLTKNKEVFFRVIGGNTHGYGQPSESVGYTPR